MSFGKTDWRRWAWARYGVAVASIAAGWLTREALTPGIGSTALPFITFFPAIAIAAWFGGLGPGIVATILSVLAANWFFIGPVHTISIGSVYDAVAMLAFILAALLIVSAMEAMHRARARLMSENAERRRVERDLANARDLLATTLASIGDGVIVTDAEGKVTFLNSEAQRLTGWKSAEARGQPLPQVFRIINEKTREPVENPVEKVLRTGKVTGLANHTVLIARDGTETAIDDSAAPIRQPDGPLFGVVLVFHDVTEQRKAHQASAQLAGIIEHSGDAIFTKSLDGVVQTWNASAERLFGYRSEEMIGKSVALLFPPERLTEEDDILDRLRQGQPVERLETIRVTKDGRRIPVAVSISPLKDEEGQLIGASKVVHDIADLVAAREALQREKELLATTLASIGDAVIVTDPEGRITFLNAEAEHLTRWTNEEAAGRPLPEIFRIINEQTRQPVENPVEKVLRLGGVVGLANHTLLVARDGTETPIDDSAAPIRQPGGPLFGVVLVFRNVAEHQKAQAELHEGQERLAGLITSAMDAVIAVDAQHRIVLFNPAAERMFGWPASKALGDSLDRFIPARFRQTHRGHIETFGQTGVTTRRMGALGTLSAVRANGDEFPIEASISQMQVGGQKLFTVILRDITDRKQAEEALREAHQQVASHAAQLETLVQQRTARLNEMVGDLEAFSYSIVHDMRAPLRGMQGFAQLLAQECGPISDRASEYVRRINIAATRMDRLIQDGLNYSRVMRAELPLMPIDVLALIRGIIETYPAFQPPHAEIELHDAMPLVKANESALTQCISNLLGNAVKFVPPGVTPRVRVWSEAHNGRVRLHFKDNGIGIERQQHERIFQIFQRLDGTYEGTGIGLAIVKKAVERMGGSVGLESEPGKGSTFWIDLTRADNT